MDKKKIVTYKDLDVYQRSYDASIKLAKSVLPHLPAKEKYDLVDQISRSSKAVPRLIAEGFAKKHQKAGFQKYLDDAMAETNETQVSLCQCRDIYGTFLDTQLCNHLISEYEIIGKQLYRLKQSWNRFFYSQNKGKNSKDHEP